MKPAPRRKSLGLSRLPTTVSGLSGFHQMGAAAPPPPPSSSTDNDALGQALVRNRQLKRHVQALSADLKAVKKNMANLLSANKDLARRNHELTTKLSKEHKKALNTSATLFLVKDDNERLLVKLDASRRTARDLRRQLDSLVPQDPTPPPSTGPTALYQRRQLLPPSRTARAPAPPSAVPSPSSRFGTLFRTVVESPSEIANSPALMATLKETADRMAPSNPSPVSPTHRTYAGTHRSAGGKPRANRRLFNSAQHTARVKAELTQLAKSLGTSTPMPAAAPPPATTQTPSTASPVIANTPAVAAAPTPSTRRSSRRKSYGGTYQEPTLNSKLRKGMTHTFGNQ